MTTTPATHRAWSDIHPDFKTTDAEGRRLVLQDVPGCGTCLVPWVGPGRGTDDANEIEGG